MRTTLRIKDMVARNPKAKESEIRRALKILASAGGPEPKCSGADGHYTNPMFPVEFTGDDEPRRVRLSGTR